MCKPAGAKNKTKNVSNADKKKAKNDKSKQQKKWKYAAIGLPLIVLIGFSIKMYVDNKPQQPRLLHYIIREYIDIANQQMHVENQMSAHLLGDPLGEILKNELRPIQERVASLRTQTSQYEKMQRIPGGPTSFMASSIKELDLIMSNYLSAIYTKVYSILLDVAKASMEITKTSEELFALSSKRLDMDSIRVMVLENVTLIKTTMEPDVEKKIEELAERTTMEEVIDKLENFAVLYDRLEEITFQASTKAEELFGVGDLRYLKEVEMTDEEYSQLVPFWDQLTAQRNLIEREKRKLQTAFAVFGLYMHRSVKSLHAMINKIKSFTEDQRFRYLKLQDMVLKDAQQLKLRIQNLQYTYAKHRSEL